MKKYFFHLVTILITTLFFSCSDNPSSPTTGSINAVVLDESTLLPIANVAISTVPSTQVVLTNAKGEFLLNDLAAQEYSISAENSAYYKKTVNVTVVAGKTSTATILLKSYKSTNHAPNVPNLITPTNNSITSTKFTFIWECTDIDSDKLVSEIYLGETISNLKLLANTDKNTQYLVENLSQNKSYFWKVIVTDIWGATAESSVNKFIVDTTTISNAELIAYYKMDGDAVDASNNKLNGTYYDVSFVQDRFGVNGKAVNFNSTNSYVKVPYSSKLNSLNNKFTYTMWVKPNSTYGYTEDVDHIILVGRWGATGTYTSSFSCKITTNGYPRVSTYSNAEGTTTMTCSNIIDLNKWTHLSYVFNGNTISIYINGVLSKTEILATPQNSNYGLLFGGQREGGGWKSHFDGAIDDVLIYNRVLSESEIKILSSF